MSKTQYSSLKRSSDILQVGDIVKAGGLMHLFCFDPSLTNVSVIFLSSNNNEYWQLCSLPNLHSLLCSLKCILSFPHVITPPFPFLLLLSVLCFTSMSFPYFWQIFISDFRTAEYNKVTLIPLQILQKASSKKIALK